MELPLEVAQKISNSLEGYKLNELKGVVTNIQNRYQNEKRSDVSLLDDELFAKVYAGYRMPATFGACSDVVRHVFEVNNEPIKTIIDVGGGTGASSLAFSSYFLGAKITSIEKSKSMYRYGKFLTENFPNISWSNQDIKDIKDNGDIVVASYMLNELKDEDLLPVISRLWEMANKCLVIIESGDKRGSGIIQKVRNYLLDKGYIIAPCPHMNKCPIKGDDWCHFSTRVQRTKIHKILKDADVPFEDEKYSFIAFSKLPVERKENRILRHPLIYGNFVRLTLCQNDSIEVVDIYKKDKEKYKKAKKVKVGDTI